jgi:hypothetical protein
MVSRGVAGVGEPDWILTVDLDQGREPGRLVLVREAADRVCGDEIRTRLAVLETDEPFCGGNGSATRAKGRRGPSAGEQSAIDKRFAF